MPLDTAKLLADQPVRYDLTKISQSMGKTMNQCPRKFKYAYVDGLIPRVAEKPLERGKWFHSLLEARYSGEDWKAVHKRKRAEYANLFDEEKEKLGDLPTELRDLMGSYIWHYEAEEREDEWEVLEVEKVIEVPFKAKDFYGSSREITLVIKFDMLVKTRHGLFLVDHKTHKRIPSLLQRELDVQSPLYLWACREAGIDVKGFIWNYVRTEGISTPTLLKDGSRFSKTLGDTTYWQFVRALKASFPNEGPKSIGFEQAVELYRPLIDRLKHERYAYGEPQTSSFFLRHVIERNDQSIEQAVRELETTANKILWYDFHPDRAERVSGASCQWMCPYTELCTAELYGRRTDHLERKYRVERDPLHYHKEK